MLGFGKMQSRYAGVGAWNKFLRASVVLTAVLGLCAGMLCANLFYEQISMGSALFAGFFLKEERTGYWWFLCRQRLVGYLCLIGAGCFRIGKWVMYALIIWFGFSFGLLCALSVAQYSLVGVLLCACGLLPQVLFYIPAFFLLFHAVMHYGLNIGMAGGVAAHRRTYTILALIGFLLCLAGVFLECYVNPELMLILLNKY